MKESNEFIFQKELETEEIGEGVTRQILGYDDNLMLVKVIFETGSIGTIHSHPHVQSSYIESGKFEVSIDGRKQILEAGDGFFIETRKAHGMKCLEAGAVIDTFTPARVDFLIS